MREWWRRQTDRSTVNWKRIWLIALISYIVMSLVGCGLTAYLW